MRPKSVTLTASELELMKMIWPHADGVTVRDVYEELRKRRSIAYTTVMTSMKTLEQKGYLKASLPAVAPRRTAFHRRSNASNRGGRRQPGSRTAAALSGVRRLDVGSGNRAPRGAGRRRDRPNAVAV